MERSSEKIKLEQNLAHAVLELKRLETEKNDLLKQMHTAEQELPRLKTEMDTYRAEAERKKKATEQQDHSVKHTFSVIDKTTPIKKQDFMGMTAKLAVERELYQKEMQFERTLLTAKGKVDGLKHQIYSLDQLAADQNAHKRDIEREIEAINHRAEVTKRSLVGKKPEPQKPITSEE